MHLVKNLRLLASGAWLIATSNAQFAQDALSFGHLQGISPNGRTIPGWHSAGEGHVPQVLSDRIILTPPVVGNARGGLWAEKEVSLSEWVLDLDFRVAGPERGTGNMQVWLTKDTQAASAMKSLYTVEKFDGLVIVLDQYQGTGGSIRGFLNDGTSNYRTHHNVDGLAFGHCDYVYRNLGRVSKIQVKQDAAGFEVKVDNKLCFKSDLIQLPTGYFFGVSAASPETPDSFEINKFVVSTPSASLASSQVQEVTPAPTTDASLPPAAHIADTPAFPEQGKIDLSSFSKDGTPDAQFMELLNRMQAATHSINNVYRELVQVEKRLHDRHDEQANKEFPAVPAMPTAQLNAMDERLTRIERIVEKIQNDVEGRDYKEHLNSLQRSLQDAQNTLLDSLPQSISQVVGASAPRMGFFIFVIIGFQVLLVGAYIIYKKRRANSPKKFL